MLHFKRYSAETRIANTKAQSDIMSLECGWHPEHIRNGQVQGQHHVGLWRSERV